MKSQSAMTTDTPKERMTKALALATFVSTLGVMQIGYNLSVINHPLVLLETAKSLNESGLKDADGLDQNIFLDFLLGLTHFIFPFGGFVGSLISGPLVDIMGRKDSMFLTNGLSVVASAIMGFTARLTDYEFIVFSRLFGGICAGLFSCIMPLYIGEISPTDLRGTTLIIAVIFSDLGSLLAFVLGTPRLLGNKKGYPGLMCFTIVPAVLSLFLLPLVPESPRYLLLQKEDDEKAIIALKKLRQRDDVEDELQELFQEEIANKPERNMNVLKLVRFRALRYQVLSVVILMAGRELCGIQMAYIYLNMLHRMVIRYFFFEYFAITISSIALISHVFLVYNIDSIGRRLPLLIGYGITNIFSILLTVTLELKDSVFWMKYITIIFLMIYIFGNELGQAPIPTLYMVELFLQSSRSSAFVLGESVKWLLNFFMSVLVHNAIKGWGTYIFLIFWPVSTITFIFIIKVIPDTHRRTFLTIKKTMSLYAARKIMVKTAPKDDFKGRARRGSRKKSSTRTRSRTSRRLSSKY